MAISKKSSKPDKVVDISDFGDKKRLAFLSQLINDNQQALMRFLRVRLANEADREDIMQEVYLRLCRIEKLADKLSLGEAPTRAFLFRVATNLIHDHFRRQGVRQDHVANDHSASGQAIAIQYQGGTDLAINLAQRVMVHLHIVGEAR